MPVVELPASLRAHTGGRAKITLEAKTVGEALQVLVQLHPPLGSVLLVDGKTLKRTVGVFVDDDDVRGEPERMLKADDVVVLIAAMAGG